MEAYIHPTSSVGAGSQLGYNSIVMENVRIGENCRIGHGVIVHRYTIIGNNVRVDDQTVIGKLPMRAALSAITTDHALPPCLIEEGVILGTSVVIYRGCAIRKNVMVADLASVRENVDV